MWEIEETQERHFTHFLHIMPYLNQDITRPYKVLQIHHELPLILIDMHIRH